MIWQKRYNMSSPKLIILISGKRKSGKDFISEQLLNRFKDNCTIVRISEPIKTYYAKTFNLDLSQLLSDGAYKEKYRLDMINWSETVRDEDYGYFCKIACENAPTKSVWIVSDIRRKTDLKWFSECYGNLTKTVRIKAVESIRKKRGWVFTTGVDDVASECDLDDVNSWDLTFENNDSKQAEHVIESLSQIIQQNI